MAQLYPGDYAALRTLWYSTPGSKAFEKLQAIRALKIVDPEDPKAIGEPWWELNGFTGPVDWPQLLEAGLWQEPPPGVAPEDT